eukprot:scaffold576_cov260-Pinguiococcus_pyrenoidosus.AAC.120
MSASRQRPSGTDGSTALHLACRLGDLARVQQLVREFPYMLNAPDVHDATPLYYGESSNAIFAMKST